MNNYYFYSEGSWAGGLTPLLFYRGKITTSYTNASDSIQSYLTARTMAEAKRKFKSYKPSGNKVYQCIEAKHKAKGRIRIF